MSDALSFCPTLADLYRTRRMVGVSGKPFTLTGGLSTVNNLLAIRHFMAALRPARTLEVGLGCGGSALAFLASHREAGSLPAHQHVAIDKFQAEFDDAGVEIIRKAGLAEYFEVVRELSSVGLGRMLAAGDRFGLIYIDGSHEFDDVFVDFYFVRRLVDVGGVVLFDDSSDRNVRRVIRYVEGDLAKAFQRIPLSAYRPLTGLAKARMRLAEAMGKTQLVAFRRLV